VTGHCTIEYHGSFNVAGARHGTFLFNCIQGFTLLIFTHNKHPSNLTQSTHSTRATPKSIYKPPDEQPCQAALQGEGSSGTRGREPQRAQMAQMKRVPTTRPQRSQVVPREYCISASFFTRGLPRHRFPKLTKAQSYRTVLQVSQKRALRQ
jgi:hypothetical protein